MAENESLADTLKKQVGPAPLYVWWGAGIVVAALIFTYLQKKKNAASKADNTGSTTSDTATNLSDTQTLPDWVAQGGQMPYQGGDVYVNIPGQTPAPTNDTSVPSKPGGLHMLNEGTKHVSLVWQPPDPSDPAINFYRIATIGPPGTGKFDEITATGTSTTRYGLKPNTKYTFNVYAVSKAGIRSLAATIPVTTKSAGAE